MKITKKIILFVLGFLFGVLGAAGVYFLTAGEVAWQEYFETKLVPNIILAITTAFCIYFGSTPTTNKVNAAVSLFTKATSDVNNTVESGKKTENKLAQQDAKIEVFTERFNELEKIVTDGLKTVKTAAENSEKILRIGFGNTAELVKKGYAAEIAKVGKTNEREKEN